MSEQLISIFPGTYHPSEVGITVRQNGQLEMNRMVQIYNGISNSTFYKGFDGELDPTTTSQVINQTYTNGMQFAPSIYNSERPLDSLNVFDASNLMLSAYSNREKLESVGSWHDKVETYRYNATDNLSG